jgi:hypothetical protein
MTGLDHASRLAPSLYLSLAFLLPAIAHAQESEPERARNIASFDTEHIFGFAEGSDIGSKGELEIESVTIGSFGELGSIPISTTKPRCVMASPMS